MLLYERILAGFPLQICSLNEADGVTMPCCSNYVEHAWRKGKCLNCFQPKFKHINASEPRATNDQANGSKLQYGAEDKCDLQLPNADENQLETFASANKNSAIVSNDSARKNDKQNTRTYKNDLPSTSNPITLSLSTVTENHRSDVGVTLKDTEPSGRKTEFTKTKPVPKPRPRRKFSSPRPCEAANTTEDREIGAVEIISIKAEDKNIEDLSKWSCTSRENDKSGTKLTQDELNTAGVSVCEGDENSGKFCLKSEQDVSSCEIASAIETGLLNLNIATGEIQNCTSDNDLLSKKHENNLRKPDTISALQEMEFNNGACQDKEMQSNTSENEYVAMSGNTDATGRHDIDDFIDCEEIAGVKEITGKEENSLVGSGVESSPRDSSSIHKLTWSLDRQVSPSRELLEDFKFELPRTTAMGARESSYDMDTDYEKFCPSMSCKVTLAEPFYENRPSSLSSESRSQSVTSSNDNFVPEKAEYENTLGRGHVVSHSPSDTLDSDVFSNGTTEGSDPSYENTIKSDPKSSSSGMSDSLKSNNGVFVEDNVVTESSGDSVDTEQSDSTWDSSEWDSQSSDSNIETSASESALGSKICTIPTIPENEILSESSLTTNSRIQRKVKFTPEKAKNRQSNPDIRDKINDEIPQSSASKLLTKPYKVVDVSSGLLFEPNSLSSDSSDVPPLPPKTRDLQKEDPEENQHEYMPPPENVPQKNQYNSPQSAPVNVGPPSSESRPQYVRKTTPIPRPRSINSERNSQFGSLPRPAPRTSRILMDSKPDRNKGPCNGKSTECPEVIPEPPSPSTIPIRQSTEGISTPPALPLSSPPLSPGDSSSSTAQTQVSDGIETPQSPKSEGGRTSEGLVAKPKRMAPPPPVGGNQRPKSPEEAKTTAARGYNNTSSANSPAGQETVNSPKSVSQPTEKPATPPLTEQLSPAPSPSMERKYFKTNSLKKAWLKFSKKRNSKNYRSLEISGPILVNEEVPGFVEQREEVKRRTMSESAGSARISVSSEIDDASPPFVEQNPSQIPSEEQQNENVEQTASQPVQFCRRSHGYQNFPLSKVDGVFERPKKPARATKAVRPLGREADMISVSLKTKGDGSVVHSEEPAYLQPCETEMTRKVEEALSKLNDATLLAEALSRVAQEKLGPLPNVPQSRHVHFHYNESKCVTDDPSTSAYAKRPVRIVNPTLVNGVAGSPNAMLDEYKTAKPKLPSRPPNTKLREGHRERSYSADGKYLFQTSSSIPRTKSESSQSRKLVKTYNKMRELHLQTLQEVVNSAKRSLLPPKNLDISSTAWKDYEICDRLLDVQCPGTVLLPVKLVGSEPENVLLAKIEVPQQSSSSAEQRSSMENDLLVSESMERHVNISRVLTHFTDQIPAEVVDIPGSEVFELNVGITDQFPRETVTDFLSRTKVEHEEHPESYEKKICLLMIQLLSALLHLHNEAVLHRDLSTDNLFLLDNGLLMIANFTHAHQQLSHSSPFLLRRDSLSHLGGNLDRLPPEILNAPEDAKILDFEKCDVFAAGCLIYEMLHEKNPYSRDSSFIKQEYQANEFFSLPERSNYSRGLRKIASRLLCPDPQQRIDAKKALEMLRVVIWGPHCLEDSGTCSLESMASDWIENERLHMVTLFALNQVQTCDDEPDDFVEKFLKCQYLVDANEQSILDSYKQVIMNAEGDN